MAKINENDKIRVGDTITCADEMDAATYIVALNFCGYGWEKNKGYQDRKNHPDDNIRAKGGQW